MKPPVKQSVFDPKFAPTTQDGLQIQELDIQEVLALVTGEAHDTNIHTYEIDGKQYEVNFGSSRYHVLKRDGLTCACCGIQANRCYLDKDMQNTAEHHFPCYHVNFYAETGNFHTVRKHMVLLTRDHIIPRIEGGSDDLDNSQCLCFNCNSLKDATSWNLDQMRHALFPAYRAYQSSIARTKTRELTHQYRLLVLKRTKGIEAIKKGLEFVKDDRAIGMKDKILAYHHDIEYYTALADRIEMEAQISGIIPDSVPPIEKVNQFA